MAHDQALPEPGQQAGTRLNVLILFDQHSCYANTVQDHLVSLARFSEHNISYAHATATTPLRASLTSFDVIIIHYSVRLAYTWHISPEFAWALQRFGKLKVLFIQDEYDNTWQVCQWIEQLGIALVFTCVPSQHVPRIYSRVDHEFVKFLPTLTGYLPLDLDPDRHVRSLHERKVVIGYRGRALAYRYGRLAREKYLIGTEMQAICRARGIPHDIEWTDDKRLYGNKWIEFVAGCRATLGTESGSNVFDFDGSLERAITSALKDNPSWTFEDVYRRYLRGREIEGLMNQVSPRIFEAVALRTGLILFEGKYSNVLQPHQHFIPLKKDFSNVEDVLDKVQNDDYLGAMTEQAYRHVVASGRYTYQHFVTEVDRALVEHFLRICTPTETDGPRKAEARVLNPGAATFRPLSTAGLVSRRPVTYELLSRCLHLNRRALRFLFRKSGISWAVCRLRRLRAAHRLVLGDEVFGDFWRRNRRDPYCRSLVPPGRLFNDLLVMALLRQYCRQTEPSVLMPCRIGVRFEPQVGCLYFTSLPLDGLPPLVPGDGVLLSAREASRQGQIKEICWEHGRLGTGVLFTRVLGRPIPFFLSASGRVRFPGLEQLAEVDGEGVSRLLWYTAKGVHATRDAVDLVAAAPPPFRQAC